MKMSNKKISAMSYNEQKEIKPLIEDVIPECLDGDMKKNALDFVAYLRANKMKPVHDRINTWKATCKGKVIFYINLRQTETHQNNRTPFWDGKYWNMRIYLDHMNLYEKQIIDEGMQNLIWDNLNYCKKCVGADGVNKPKLCTKTITVLGKEINNFGCWPLICAHNPDEATINGIKRLLELEKRAREEKAVKK